MPEGARACDTGTYGCVFDSRLDGYEEHQLTCIESAGIFYPFTASLLPMAAGCEVLDLGCGTGLELDAYFERNPDVAVTGIDLAPGMLEKAAHQIPEKAADPHPGLLF